MEQCRHLCKSTLPDVESFCNVDEDICIGSDECGVYHDENLENIVEKDFCKWLEEESKKLNLDADHFGEILGRIMFSCKNDRTKV